MRWFCAALFSFVATASALAADDSTHATWTALRDGSKVVLIRHGATTGGAGDPPGFRLEDCATQRNLTDKGVAESKATGERIRAQKVNVGKVISSQWCRCRDTAELMNLGQPVEIAPTFNNAYTFSDRRDELTKGARAVIGAWKGPGALVIVTHGANILPLTGFQPAEGEMIVVEPEAMADGRLRVIGRIPVGS
ncbi:MAG TPA: histidine phosphatase family protein [Pseudorhodoplanes sp.]|nr:histidine phosphatase family protein [Pseudorhodoplanes sp.]